jgi:hypothetical protein
MSRDGSFYWVFANVTPSLDAQGKLEGYFSVRRKPKAAAIAVVADLYRHMLAEERRAGPRDACAASLAIVTSLLAKNGASYESFVLSI